VLIQLDYHLRLTILLTTNHIEDRFFEVNLAFNLRLPLIQIIILLNCHLITIQQVLLHLILFQPPPLTLLLLQLPPFLHILLPPHILLLISLPPSNFTIILKTQTIIEIGHFL